MSKENNAERFKRVAESRTNKILVMIRLLGNCSNKNAYFYTDEQINKIFSALEKELKISRERFETTNNKPRKFEL